MCDWDRYNAVRLAIPLIVGMATAHFFFPHFAPPLLWLVVPTALSAAVVAAGARWPLAQGGAVQVLGLSLGALLLTLAAQRVESGVPAGGTVSATVESAPQAKARSYAVGLETGRGRVLVYLQKNARAARLLVGDTVELRHVRWQPTSPRLRPDSPYAYYDDYLFHHGVAARGYASGRQWSLRARAGGADGENLFGVWRRRALALYRAMDIEGDEGAVVEAMTLGDKQRLTPAQRDAFAASGLSHLLALSGFHLTILLTLFNVFLLRSRLPWRGRQLMGLLIIPALWSYAALTGFSPSLVRAVVMCTILQVTLLLRRDYQMLNALALAALAMLIVQPLALLDVGFQLSFLSMLGIGLMAVPLMRRLPRPMPWGTRYVADTLVVSLSCTLFTLPLVAYYFGRVPLLSLLSNVVAALIATALMWAAVAWWTLAGWSAAQAVVSPVLLWLARALGWVATTVGSLPAATLTLRPTLLDVVLLYVALGAAVHFLHHRRLRALMLSLAALLALEFLSLSGPN